MIDWPLALILLVVGTVLAVLMGRGWIPRRHMPLSGFLLVLIAVGVIVALNESWHRYRDARDERLHVLAALREMRVEVADYRRMLARAIPPDAGGGYRAERVAFTPAHEQIPDALYARLQHHPLLLKHVSGVSYNPLATLMEGMDSLQSQLAGADDEEFVQLVMLLQRDVELLDKLLHWESIYQQGIFSLAELTGYVEQLERARSATH